MDYELLNEDENSYHLKDPKGKELRIAKQALSDALHEKIKGYAKGGLVEEDESSNNSDDPLFNLGLGESPAPRTEITEDYTSKYNPRDLSLRLPETPVLSESKFDPSAAAASVSGLGKKPDIQPQFSGYQAAPSNLVASNGGVPRDAIGQPIQMEVPVGGEATPQAQKAGVPGLPEQQGSGFDSVFGQMIGANKLQAQAQQQYYKTAEQEQNAVNARNMEIDNLHSQEMAGLEKQQGELMNAFMTQKVDPSRLWSNASTGSKISAGIGLILGGLGAGLTGGPNQALQVINRLVDQDIDAQKTELGKKQTLYSMNLQKFRDANTAYAATKAQLAAGLQGKLASAAAAMGTQQAKASEMQANAQINLYRQQLNQQVAQAQTARAVLGHIGKTGDVSYAGYLPEKQREDALNRAVPGFGLATTKEAAAKANELVTTTKAGVDMINQLKSFANKTGSSISPNDKADAETLSRMIMGQIREGVLGPGTVNDAERAILEKIVANPTNVFQMSSTAKTTLDRIINTLETKQRIGLTQYGLKPPAKLDRGAPIR